MSTYKNLSPFLVTLKRSPTTKSFKAFGAAESKPCRFLCINLKDYGMRAASAGVKSTEEIAISAWKLSVDVTVFVFKSFKNCRFAKLI